MSQPQQLARKITFPLLLFYGLGNILGAGIYVLVGEVAGMSGIYAPFSFCVALVIASFTALSYSELVARFPDSAGVALYVKEGLNSVPFSVVAGLTIAFGALLSAATISRGFAGYLAELVVLPEVVVIVGIILVLGGIAIWGIGESVAIASALTLFEIGGLLLILWVGAPAYGQLPERLPELIPPLQFEAWYAVMLGGFLAFFAFLGFEDMVNIAEEVKEPSRTFPKAILAALAVSTLLYISVSLLSILLLPLEELKNSSAPFAQMYEKATGSDPIIITSISLLAIINGALIQIIMASRMVYGLSKRRWLPHALSYVNSSTKTPVAATVCVVAITIAFALWLPLVSLANLSSSLILVVFTVVNISLVRIKLRDPKPQGVRIVPLWVPIAGMSFNIMFLGVQLFAVIA